MVKLSYTICNLCTWGQTCADEGWNSTVMQLIRMRDGTQYNVHSLCSLGRWCRTCADVGWNIAVMQLVQMRVGTQYNIHLLCNVCKWGQTCTNEGWITVQYSFAMQCVQMRSNLYKWGVDHSTMFIVMQLVQMRLTCANEVNLSRWGVENGTIVICYATCVRRWG